jgi:hypothetical protein
MSLQSTHIFKNQTNFLTSKQGKLSSESGAKTLISSNIFTSMSIYTHACPPLTDCITQYIQAEGNPFLVMTSKKFHFTLKCVFSKSILRINPFFLLIFSSCITSCKITSPFKIFLLDESRSRLINNLSSPRSNPIIQS